MKTRQLISSRVCFDRRIRRYWKRMYKNGFIFSCLNVTWGRKEEKRIRRNQFPSSLNKLYSSNVGKIWKEFASAISLPFRSFLSTLSPLLSFPPSYLCLCDCSSKKVLCSKLGFLSLEFKILFLFTDLLIYSAVNVASFM